MSKQNLEENVNTVQHYIDLGWKVETEVRHTEDKNDEQPIYIETHVYAPERWSEDEEESLEKIFNNLSDAYAYLAKELPLFVHNYGSCPYCGMINEHGKHFVINPDNSSNNTELYIGNDNKLHQWSHGITQNPETEIAQPIKFCPFCGKPLTSEKEDK